MDDIEHVADRAITTKTLIPIGMLIGAATTVFLAGTYVARLDARLEVMANRLSSIEQHVGDNVSRGELSAWARLLHAMNPTVNVPEVSGN